MIISKRTDALTRQFKALGDPQRLRIVALCRAGELSVGELTEVLGQSQPRVSQHLKVLCAAGLLDRFRDGKRVYYRLAEPSIPEQRRLIALIGDSEARFDADRERLREIRGAGVAPAEPDDPTQRAIARALIELTLAGPLGDLLDIGCGRGRVLKLLASRAKRALGVDIDSQARNIARVQLFMAGVENCSLRQGDMYQLDFADGSFDTIVLDDVLTAAERPGGVLDEACRLLRPTGRLLVLQSLGSTDAGKAAADLAALCSDCGLRMAPPKQLPSRQPAWLLSVLTRSDTNNNPQSEAVAA